MWLLSSSRAELHYFPSPESVPGGYAILSHVWDPPNEQSFQSIQALQKSCAESGLNPRDCVSDKIRECCKLAERRGDDWVWIDTCCIDKTSSTELSEAINSMFRYYSLANICYAFLADVPTGNRRALSQTNSAFRTSRWYKRGWTLQELLAPSELLFVSESWEMLGSKAQLSEVLEEVTRVPVDAFLNPEEIVNTSVAQRMSWAAGRETTRLEDEAYCLMGIFRINMPTLYGEGRQAFRRLQQEIMRNYADTSLFAWGNAPSLSDIARIDAHRLNHFSACQGIHDLDTRLLATSPSDFANAAGTKCALIDPTQLYIPQPIIAQIHAVFRPPPWPSGVRNMSQTPSRERRDSKSIPDLPTFEIIPYGIRAHIPLLQVGHLQMAILFSYHENPKFPGQQHLALLLSQCSPERNPLLNSLPLYCIGHRIKYRTTPETVVMFQPRMAVLTGDLETLEFYRQKARWADIYIRDDPIPELTVSPTKHVACLRPGERIDHKRYALLSTLLRVHSHYHFAWDSMGRLLRRGYSLTLFQPQQGTAVIGMKNATHLAIWIVLGKCLCDHMSPGDMYWARLVIRPYGTHPLHSIAHACEDDHIGAGTAKIERTFKFYDNHQFCSVKLSFAPTPGLNGVLQFRVSEIRWIKPSPEDLKLAATLPEANLWSL